MSPDRLETDVQDGAGGLQDLSLLCALARLNPGLELPDGLDEAHRVFATARCFLHFRDGYDANRLDFDAQAGLAAPPFRLDMRAYFEHARAVDRGLRYAAERLEARHIGVSLRRVAAGEFRAERDRTVLRAPDLFARDSGAVPRLAEFVAANGILPSEDVLSAARRAGSSLPAVLSWESLSRIAAAPHAAAALRTLYNAGALSRVDSGNHSVPP